MTAVASSRMSRVDTAWLRMDNDVNLMMIVGVWLLTPAITLEALRERVQDKLLKYGRFRQRAVADAMMHTHFSFPADLSVNRKVPIR